jgi:predicted  nucleic acid-binding Zn-ribbon protein
MPIIDIIVGVALFAGTAVLWYNTRGQEQVIAAREQLDATRQEQANELAARRLEIEDYGEQLIYVQNDHESKKQVVALLEQSIKDETAKIEEGRDKDRRYTDVLLTLRDDIRLATDELRGNEAGVTEEENRIARRQAEIDSLQAEVLTRERRISELENETAEALAIRRHDPISIFPVKAGSTRTTASWWASLMMSSPCRTFASVCRVSWAWLRMRTPL